MGLLKNQLKHEGFNLKERAYVYAGGAVGAVAPIVGARYILFGGINTDNPWAEALAWGGSVVMNLSTMVFSPHLPAPVYTAMGGIMIGTFAAENSKMKRYEKESKLEKEFGKSLSQKGEKN